MTTNERTIAMGGEKKEVKNNNASREWKNVAIGGAAGIMFGAGTAYAASKLIDGDEPTAEDNNGATGSGTHDVAVEPADMATVSNGQSFSEAFAQARAEVGPGGAFRWNGGVYGTYTKDEWDAMSPEEQHQFSQNAISAAGNATENGSVHVNNGNAGGGTHVENHNPAETPVQNTTLTQGPNTTSTQESGSASDPNVRQINHDSDPASDVHVVGVHDEQLADGSVVTVGQLEGEGINNDIVVVDVDRDSVFDVAICDVNDNGQLDDGEIADISDAGLRVPDTGTDPNLHTAQNDIAPDMPDYMNDADVHMA